MGNYAEAVADFDAVINNPNVTEKVWEIFFIGNDFSDFQIKINAELKRANTKIHQRDLEGAMYEYDQCIINHPNECSPRVHRGMVCSNLFSFNLI